jgi:hypothetical protein
MDNKLFRKTSYDSISSPEDLSNYIHVTTISVWGILLTIIAVMIAIFVWGSVVSVESMAYGTAVVKDKSMTVIFDDSDKADNIKADMTVQIEGISFAIENVGRNLEGKVIANGIADLADGEYRASVGYKSTRIISMLFN